MDLIQHSVCNQHNSGYSTYKYTQLYNSYVCVCVCVTDLAERVGLSIPVEVVPEPPAERQQHDLNGQTQRRRLGRGRRRPAAGGHRPLG